MFGRGWRSLPPMEPDLHAQQVSTSTALRKQNVPINYKDAVPLLEIKIKTKSTLEHTHGRPASRLLGFCM